MYILDEHKLKYLNRRKIELDELKSALQNNDFETIINIGHRLKGNGETFGFPLISTIGIHLEKAAHDQDRESIHQSMLELVEEVDKNLKSL